MYVIEDRLIMMEFVIVQKHAFILFVSDSYRKEIQERERPSEKGIQPTVFRQTPTVLTIAVMKNQAVTTICGLITGNQLHNCLLLFGLSTTTSQHMWFHFFTFESYGLYEVEQGGKEDGIFVSDGVQFHISCLQLQWRRKIHHDSYMVTFPLIVLVVRASMLRQLLLKPVL
ncbi:hypothetical protein Hanom_Chr03g00211111 [Helianthus anomalus]